MIIATEIHAGMTRNGHSRKGFVLHHVWPAGATLLGFVTDEGKGAAPIVKAMPDVVVLSERHNVKMSDWRAHRAMEVDWRIRHPHTDALFDMARKAEAIEGN